MGQYPAAQGALHLVAKKARKSRYLLLLLAPTLFYYGIFQYGAMYGIKMAQFNLATAVGIFNSVANFIVLLLVNMASRSVTEHSPW